MVTIKEVSTKKDLKKFVAFSNSLYKKNPYYVPDLLGDAFDTLDKDKNPAYDFCESAFFIALRDGELVGRIAVLINHESNKKWKESLTRFSHFDFIDDYDVSKALMDKALEYTKSKNMSGIHGPMGFTDMDHQGMLVEGFQELDMFITIYNHPYYINHMKALGFQKEIDWVEYQVRIPRDAPEFMSKLSERVKNRYGYREIVFNRRKDILPWAEKVFQLYNEAYAPLFGSTLLSQKQIDLYIKSFFGFVNKDFIQVVVDSDDQVVAFGICMPSLSKAMQKAKGRLFPFGFIHILKSIRKNRILDMYLVAVSPIHQGKGVNAILMNGILQSAINYGIEYAETGPELETNTKVQSQWKHFESRQHKRRRVWIKNLSDDDDTN